MKVYVVSIRQGDYDDARETILWVFSKKNKADNYVEKAKVVFNNLYDFYSGIRLQFDYNNPLFRTALHKANKYEPGDFYIEEFELR